MKVTTTAKSIYKKGAETVGEGAGKVAKVIGEAVESDITNRVIGVAVDGISDAVFSPVETVVARVDTVAEITGSPTLKTAHNVAASIVTDTKDLVTSGTKRLLGGAAKISGNKLTAIGKKKN